MSRPGRRLALASLVLAACAAPPAGPRPAAPGRIGVHGMTVFGGARVFMSHIPMFRPPHDAQILLEVTLPEPRAFDGLFTFEPERFSLDELAYGGRTQMRGTLYRGSFERGGTPIAENLHVKIARVIEARIGLDDERVPTELTYWLVESGADAYLVHVLGRAPSFDQIVEVKLARPATGVVSVDGRPDTLASRLVPGGAAAPGITVVREVSCLVGPDFVTPCP